VVVALAGWNHAPELWRDKSVIAQLADQYGCILACPDLGKSIYETAYFTETTGVRNPAPGTPWLVQVLLPYLKAHYPAGERHILGYSTGGRGAVMGAIYGGPFRTCASLSGTFDLATLRPGTGEYRIHAQVYGERARFPQRWLQESCNLPLAVAPLRACRFYLAHGSRDPVVEASQTREMSQFLNRNGIVNELVIEAGSGHDWAFWNGQLPAVFQRINPARTPRIRCRGWSL
jgi:S-formylglutathione hydrolase FrmB